MGKLVVNQLSAEVNALKERDQGITAELPLPPNHSLRRKKEGSTRKRAPAGAEVSENRQQVLTRAQKRVRAAKEKESVPGAGA